MKENPKRAFIANPLKKAMEAFSRRETKKNNHEKGTPVILIEKKVTICFITL